MNKIIVDSHCHLDLFPEFKKAINVREDLGILTLTMTTTPKAWSKNVELCKDKKYIRPALGLHPQLVVERGHEIDLWEKYLPEAIYIGEVGLDAGPAYYRSFTEQVKIFERIIKSCSDVGGRIISVHCVRSAGKVLDIVERYLPQDKGRIILHWFSGTRSEAERAVKLGCFFSVNIKMLGNEKKLNLIKSLPINRILIESDAPFLGTEIGDIGIVGGLERTTSLLSREFDMDDKVTSEQLMKNFKFLLKNVRSNDFDWLE